MVFGDIIVTSTSSSTIPLEYQGFTHIVHEMYTKTPEISRNRAFFVTLNNLFTKRYFLKEKSPDRSRGETKHRTGRNPRHRNNVVVFVYKGTRFFIEYGVSKKVFSESHSKSAHVSNIEAKLRRISPTRQTN